MLNRFLRAGVVVTALFLSPSAMSRPAGPVEASGNAAQPASSGPASPGAPSGANRASSGTSSTPVPAPTAPAASPSGPSSSQPLDEKAVTGLGQLTGESLKGARELHELARRSRAAGDIEETLRLLEAALDAARAEGQPETDQAGLMAEQGEVLIETSRATKPPPRTTGKVPRESAEVIARAAGLCKTGREHLASDRPADALRQLDQALVLLEQAPDPDLEREVRLTAATASLRTGRTSRALRHLTAALPRLEAPSDRALKAKTLNQIALLQAALGASTTARQSFDRALELYRALNDRQSVARTLDDLAGLSFRDGAWLSAADTYQAATDAWEQLKAVRESIIGWTRIAWCYEKLGLQDRAREALDQALVRTHRHALRELEASLQARAGRDLLARGLPKEAKQAFEKSVSLRGLAYKTASWIAPLGLARATAWSGGTGADEAYEVALSALDRSTADAMLNPIDLPWLGDRELAYQEVVDRYLSAGMVDAALEVAERGRVRRFRDLIESRAGSPLLGGGGGTGHTLVGRGPAYDEVTDQIEFVLQGQAPASSVDPLPQPSALKAPAMRAVAKQYQATLLSYYRVGDDVAVWVVTPEGSIQASRLDGVGARVDRSIGLLLELLEVGEAGATADPGAQRTRLPPLRELLTGLYRELVTPVAKVLPAEGARIGIVSDRSLAAIPFGTLIDEHGHFFVHHHPVVVAPTAAFLSGLRPTGKGAELNLVGDGVRPGVAPPAERLELIERALRQGLYQDIPDSLGVIQGRAATEETLIQVLAGPTRVQVAARAFYHFGHPWLSGILLDRAGETRIDDGVLTVVELPFGQLKARLLVLPPFDGPTAAQTQRFGLELGLLSSGVKQVVMPLGMSGLTGDLANRFYAGVRKGLSPPEALRTAQLEALNAGADLRSIAGLTLVGAL